VTDARFRKKTSRDAPSYLLTRTEAQIWADGYNQALEDFDARFRDEVERQSA
jgi:hypothetical protein